MKSEKTEFTYTNLSHRPTSLFLGILKLVSRGVRDVQNQIEPYANSWRTANLRAIEQTGPLWVVLGDSMSQGIGASSYDKGWVGQTAALLEAEGRHYRVVNLSVSGARIEDVIERQLPAMRRLGTTPDLVTVMVGSNNLIRRKHSSRVLERLQQLFSLLPKGTLVANIFSASGAAPITTRGKATQFLSKEAPRYGLRPIHLEAFFNGSNRHQLAADHFHPNDYGYSVVADIFAKAIRE
jgi:lysophospholipase L1-like esterase